MEVFVGLLRFLLIPLIICAQRLPIRINCGGPEYTANGPSGLPVNWAADTYFLFGAAFSATKSITGTQWDPLYQTERWARGGFLSYEIPVPTPGIYVVNLHFSEIWFTAPGQRVFNVDVEGAPILGVDPVKDGGSPFATSMKSLVVSVNDGFVSIIFQTLLGLNFPKVSAIEVLEASSSKRDAEQASVGEIVSGQNPPLNPMSQTKLFAGIRINCGSSTSFTDSMGQVWEADRSFTGIKEGSTTLPILGTTDDVLFQTDRWGDFSYEIPVPLGDYEVVLWFAEIWFKVPAKRLFSLVVEGRELPNIDIYGQAGGSFVSTSREVSVTVDDGALSIEVIFGINNPKLSAIEIKLLAPHLAHSVPGGPYSVVDVDGNGFELVSVDGSQSHTHAPGLDLVSFEWSVGSQIVGTSEKDILSLGVGTHGVKLRVVDSNGNESTESTVVHILGPDHPNLSKVTPSAGSVNGGTLVSITGTSLSKVTGVRFGDFLLLTFTVVNDSLITVESPEIGVAVPVDVSVIAQTGTSGSVKFTYIGNAPISFNIRKLFQISDPTSVAFGPDRKLYVGSSEGKLTKITLDSSFTKVLSAVSSSVAPGRFILGIAFSPLETETANPNPTVYCSSSKMFHEEEINSGGLAVNGKVHAVSGANLDVVTDIVTGLPVSDHDHGVNGLEFGDNGELYILIGGNTNGGIPGKLSSSQNQKESFLSAAALVAHTGKVSFNGFVTYDNVLDGNPVTGYGPDGVEVYSSGLRNPFGIVLHSNGNLYATDNGPNLKYGDMAAGCEPGQQISDVKKADELNLLIRDGYYGHPNFKRAETDGRQCVWEGNEQTEPMLMLKSSSTSLIEFTSDHFGGQLRGNLIVSKYKGGLFRIILSNGGSSVDPSSDPAVPIGGDSSLSITQAPNGVIIDARYIKNELFYFEPKEPVSSETSIKAIFPRRGGEAGGGPLHIYGENFPSSPRPLVFVGSNLCSDSVRISSNEIKCVIPGGPHGSTVDVSATFGMGVQTTFAMGYRYIKGVE